MVCKGTCVKYKISKPSKNDDGRYAQGQKRCTTCGLFVAWDGSHCPCCNTLLRLKPRNTPDRRRLQNFNMIQRI